MKKKIISLVAAAALAMSLPGMAFAALGSAENPASKVDPEAEYNAPIQNSDGTTTQILFSAKNGKKVFTFEFTQGYNEVKTVEAVASDYDGVIDAMGGKSAAKDNPYMKQLMDRVNAAPEGTAKDIIKSAVAMEIETVNKQKMTVTVVLGDPKDLGTNCMVLVQHEEGGLIEMVPCEYNAKTGEVTFTVAGNSTFTFITYDGEAIAGTMTAVNGTDADKAAAADKSPKTGC